MPMKFFEGILAAVPQGKALFWIVIGAVTSFGAGFGMAFGVGDASDNLALVPVLRDNQAALTTRVGNVEVRLGDAEDTSERILCLVRLTATGEEISPLEIDERCP